MIHRLYCWYKEYRYASVCLPAYPSLLPMYSQIEKPKFRRGQGLENAIHTFGLFIWTHNNLKKIDTHTHTHIKKNEYTVCVGNRLSSSLTLGMVIV